MLHRLLWLVENDNRGISDLLAESMPDKYLLRLTAQTLGGNTPAVYRDPVQFFQQTYLTRSLHALLSDVMRALGGGGGDRVLQLRTPFVGSPMLKTYSF